MYYIRTYIYAHAYPSIYFMDIKYMHINTKSNYYYVVIVITLLLYNI